MKTAPGLKGYIRRPMAARVLAAAEIGATVGLILLNIWVVQPLHAPGLDLGSRVAVGLLLFASPFVHRDSLARLGLRLDTLGAALWRLVPISGLATGLAVAGGYVLGSIDPPANLAAAIGTYVVWAAAQEYALQSIVLLRLEDIGLRRGAPLAAAAIFAVVHAPNPGLMILTFFGGLLWCSTFQKHPSVLAVALSHALLAVAVVSTMPPGATGGLRIGPAYLQR